MEKKQKSIVLSERAVDAINELRDPNRMGANEWITSMMDTTSDIVKVFMVTSDEERRVFYDIMTIFVAFSDLIKDLAWE